MFFSIVIVGLVFVLNIPKWIALALTQSLSLVMPAWSGEIVRYIFSYSSILNGILPLYPNTSATGLWATVGLYTIIGSILVFIPIYYTIRLAIKGFPLISNLLSR